MEQLLKDFSEDELYIRQMQIEVSLNELEVQRQLLEAEAGKVNLEYARRRLAHAVESMAGPEPIALAESKE